MRSNINNPDYSLPHHVRGAFRGYETALSRYLAPQNLPLSQFHILRLQWDETGQTQKNIAEKSFMTESVASQVIKAMEKDGLLRRQTDRADARKKLVFITEKGIKIRERIVVTGITLLREHAPDISVDDVKTTINVLIKVREAFDAYNAEYMKNND